MFPPDEKRPLNILEETAVFEDNRVETGLLWKSNVPHLPPNRKTTINRLASLERKSQKSLDFANLYQDQIEEYIALCHERQLSEE